jgi:hypothetical protein
MLNGSRVKAFTDEKKAERVGRFFKALAGIEEDKAWCIKNRMPLTKATGESSDSVGGFLAPQDFDDAVINIRETVGAFRRGAQVRPARSDNQVRPRRTGGVTANVVAENAAIPESSFLLDAVETSTRKMAVLSRDSTELLEDSAPDLGEFLTSEIGYAFAAKEDDWGFNGDGTSTYSGKTGLGTKLAGLKGAIAAAAGHHTFLTLDTTDLGNLMGGVMATAIPGAAWYCSQVCFAQAFCRLAGSGGGGYMETRMIPLPRPMPGEAFGQRTVDGVLTPCYLGFPIFFSAKLPDGSSSLTGNPMLYFGNLAMSSLITERRKLTVAVSFHRALDADQVLIRGSQRIDLINHSVGDASTRGPIAMLTGTA